MTLINNTDFVQSAMGKTNVSDLIIDYIRKARKGVRGEGKWKIVLWITLYG